MKVIPRWNNGIAVLKWQPSYANLRRPMTLGSRRFLSFGLAAVICAFASGGSAAVSPSVEKQRALLDRYCVTCHNDRLKTANLSLQSADLTQVPDHAELWEKVIRKLRAGVMPPPDLVMVTD